MTHGQMLRQFFCFFCPVASIHFLNNPYVRLATLKSAGITIARTRNSEGHARQTERKLRRRAYQLQDFSVFQHHRTYTCTAAHREAHDTTSRAVNAHCLSRYENDCWGVCSFDKTRVFR